MDIKYLEYPFQFFIQILIQNVLSHLLTLSEGFIGYAQQDFSLADYRTKNYRINKRSEFMDACIANYLTQETLKKIYLLYLTKQHEQKYKYNKKRFKSHTIHLCSQKKEKAFFRFLTSNT